MWDNIKCLNKHTDVKKQTFQLLKIVVSCTLFEIDFHIHMFTPWSHGRLLLLSIINNEGMSATQDAIHLPFFYHIV